MNLATTPVRFGCGSIAEPVPIYFDVLEPTTTSDKPTVVMLHGGGPTGACYLSTVDGRPGWAQQFVRHGYRVIVPDWPGRGRSGYIPAGELTGQAVCDGFGALIRSVGAPVVLMTHSMGGAFGWKLLETHGDLILRLIGVAPAPPGNIQPRGELIREEGDEIEAQALGHRHRFNKRALMPLSLAFIEKQAVGGSTRFPRELLPAYTGSLQAAEPRLLYERLNIGGSQLSVERYEKLRGKPILILTGTDDTYHSREEDGRTAEWLRGHGARVEYWYLRDLGIEGNGHMLMSEDNSDELAELMLKWLETG